jgi:hypothetical protein
MAEGHKTKSIGINNSVKLLLMLLLPISLNMYTHLRTKSEIYII